MSTGIKFIINPNAAGGTALKKWEKSKKIIDAYFYKYDFELTKQKNHATQIVKHALKDGIDTLIAVGGDGTLNEVINGFYEQGKFINPDAKLAIISMGTGCDFSRVMDSSQSIKENCERILNGRIRHCNIASISCNNETGKPVERYFINIAEAGFGGETICLLSKKNNSSFPKFLYLKGLLQTISTYNNKVMKIEVDGALVHDGRILAAIFANGKYFGGGMKIAPNARIDDNMFDIVLIGDLNKVDIFRNLRRLYNGTICDHPKVKYLRGRQIKIESDEKVLLESDGDFNGYTPAALQIQTEMINLIC